PPAIAPNAAAAPRGPARATGGVGASSSAGARLSPAAAGGAAAARPSVPVGSTAQDWIHFIPAQPVDAAVGDLVWAAFMTGDALRVEPCRVVTVYGSLATLVGNDGVVHESIGGALVHRVTDQSKLKAGDVVTYYDWRRDL